MKESLRKKELIQFKAIMIFSAIVYPVWLIYGVRSGNYTGPIIVGFISAWAVWYIRYVKSKAADCIEKEGSSVDWYSLSIDKYINIPVLISSLFMVMLLCVFILVTLNVFNNAN